MRGAVLAGGYATRFGGRPKGLERVGGERLLDRVVDAVSAATDTTPVIVANQPGAAKWRADIEVLPDVMRGRGSLGGIYTAVTAAPDPVLIVAWDMPFITAELLSALVKGAKSFDAFLPASEGPLRVEPLCAVYGPACADPIRRSIDDEDYRTTTFLDHVRSGRLALERIQELGDPERLFFNVNTPDDLAYAERLLRGEISASG